MDLSVIWKALVVAGALLIGVLSSLKLIKSPLPDDNPIEEMIEEQIENYTGVDIDLTPSSPEKRTPEHDAKE